MPATAAIDNETLDHLLSVVSDGCNIAHAPRFGSCIRAGIGEANQSASAEPNSHCRNVPLLTQSFAMIDRSKKITARFYLTPAGGNPVREWLLELSTEDRRIIGKDIQKVEFGWPIGMPYCRSLGRGLWEVRSDLSGGRIARVIFFIVNGEMILLHGFEKRSQKTPGHDIELAFRRSREIRK
jgi:phage-related protein